MSCHFCSTHLRPDEHGECTQCGARYDGPETEIRPKKEREVIVIQEKPDETNEHREGKQLDFFGRDGKGSRRAA